MADRSTPLTLLRRRNFLPLFMTQFLGATNDNFYKNTVFLLTAFSLAKLAGLDGAILVNIGTTMFVLPFFLFSATAGQLADRYEKSRIIRIIKLCEIAIMAMAVIAFALQDVYLLLGVLFLMGAQSAFFGPVKYSIIPDHLAEQNLIAGNALVEGGTFLAILIGTIAAGIIIDGAAGTGLEIVSGGLIVIAVLGWISSRFIPEAGPADPSLKINFNFLTETWALMKLTHQRRDLFLVIIGISWFWLLGAVLLTQIAPLSKDYLLADDNVATLLLAIISIGIGAGSILCARLLKGDISARFVPFAAIGMAVFMIDLYFATGAAVTGSAATLLDIPQFLDAPENWRICADIALVAMFGGVFTVPLYTLMQHRADPTQRSRVIAGNNVLNALFMVVGSLAATMMLAFDFTIPQVFLAMACATVVVAIYICGLLPNELVKVVAAGLMRFLYRVEVKGLEHYRAAGDRAVIIVNHVSFLDGALLAAFLPGAATFAINTHIAKKWWAKPFLGLIDALPLDPTKPMAAKSLIKAVQSGKKCVIFPEGRITVTGALMKVYEGPGMVAEKTGAPIIPVRIDGAQFSPFSRIRDKVRTRWFPKITLTVLEPQEFQIPDHVRGRDRREMASLQLYDMMTEMIFATCNTDMTLFQALVEGRGVHGRKCPVVEDIERAPLTYQALITRSYVLGRRLAAITGPDERVGVLLPNSAGAAVTFFALQAMGRVPAMLNFSTGLNNMLSACQTAQVKTILTSRLFVRMAKMEEVIAGLGETAEIVYLEDMRKQIGALDKLYGLIASRFAGLIGPHTRKTADDPSVVLFTSGSEGQPKGVVLSHRNLLSNIQQLGAKVDFNPTDIVFNALPVFHSFGLTGGMLLPVLSGIKSFLYPSPLHYRIVPELVYDINATIMFGTDTFLSGYARMAHPYDFYSIRYIFAGAERVKDETRRIWSHKFGLRILEGYGATETSPVLAINTQMHYRPGTVGRFLPGITHRIEAIPGIEKGGKLIVSGANIMLGYLRAENPGVLEPSEDGWYDTGDIVEIDESGYITIAGRAKRFAKIGGEMVSLTAAEGQAATLWPDHQHAVVSVPDERKGEAIILVTDNPEASRDALLADAQSKGIVELMVPKSVIVAEAVPLLGTGKIDYVSVQGLVENGGD
jgi:acyl-[acyl-carrier-protein]-phospholipid O-acyltransferase/long-chain-fatty-acid--[acyl-carrier-protein] ligase